MDVRDGVAAGREDKTPSLGVLLPDAMAVRSTRVALSCGVLGVSPRNLTPPRRARARTCACVRARPSTHWGKKTAHPVNAHMNKPISNSVSVHCWPQTLEDYQVKCDWRGPSPL